MTELRIRNMVCRHCIEAVRAILGTLGIEGATVELGLVTLPGPEPDADTLARLDSALAEAGFERILSPEARTVEEVRHAVMRHVRGQEPCPLNLSACIEQQTGQPYTAVSRIFSRIEGRTIESYCTAMRVERVKELIGYGELTMSEIAYRTGFSSVAHLSRRFKELTGMTPTAYKSTLGASPRRPLPSI